MDRVQFPSVAVVSEYTVISLLSRQYSEVNSTRRFLLRNVLFRPSVLIPMLGGLGCGLASWLTGGNTYLTSLSILGVAGSAAWMLTRTFLNVEELTDQALAAKQDAARQAKDAELDQLAKQLRTDRDPRTKDSLSLLRSLRDEFEQLTDRPGFQLRSIRFREQITQVLDVATEQLRESFRLFERSEAIVGDARKQVLEQRDKIVQDVVATVQRVQGIVDQFRSITKEDQETDLQSLQDELDVSLEVAKRTEERRRELDQPNRLDKQYLNQDR